MTIRESGYDGAAMRSQPYLDGALSLFYDAFFKDPLLTDFYGDSGHANLGYWDENVTTAAQAGDRLVDKVIGQALPTRGTLLEVACGSGGGTARLAEHVDPELITAVGKSPSQLRATRARVPEAHVALMDASRLAVADASFDTIVCIEAAFHFQTREQFFREALRALRPGGRLLCSDLLMAAGTRLTPKENYLRGTAGYEALLRRCGFVGARAADVTAQTWRAYRRKLTEFACRARGRYPTSYAVRDLLITNIGCAYSIRSCVIVEAAKPLGGAVR